MTFLTCFTWNTAKRLKSVKEQSNLIITNNPDIVALQEITLNTEKYFKNLLESNYKNIISSFDLAKNKNILNGKRMFGQIIATNLDLKPLDPMNFKIPWNERVLSVLIKLQNFTLNFHTTHIPPGSSNGWIKIETLEGIYNRVIELKDELNILCGDFNTPKDEDSTNGLMTFAQRIDSKGNLKTKVKLRGGSGDRWDKGERNILLKLKEYGVVDSFRTLFTYNVNEFSWTCKNRDKIIKRRFDHFFASRKFKVMNADYLHQYNNLSDHSPLIVKYEI
jgi:exonuclease III